MSDVEWVFGDILPYFAFLDLALLAQCNLFVAYLEMLLDVFYGSTTSDHFDLQPQTIQEYFQI